MRGTRELLAEHPFLAGLAPAWLDRLTGCAHPVYRNAGHRLFDDGRPAMRFWLVRTGRVALDIDTPGRGHVVIDTLGPGTVLGWSWLFPPRQWQFGAVVVEPIRAVEFSAPAVRQLMADDPDLGYELTRRFMAVMYNRLQATRLRLLDLYAYAADAPGTSNAPLRHHAA